MTTRNEAAERLRNYLDDTPVREWDGRSELDLLDAALAHERQQGREEAVPSDIRKRHHARTAEQCPDDNHFADLHAILDIIASPSEHEHVWEREYAPYYRPTSEAYDWRDTCECGEARTGTARTASPSEEPKE